MAVVESISYVCRRGPDPFVVLALVLTRATLRAVDFSNQLIRGKKKNGVGDRKS